MNIVTIAKQYFQLEDKGNGIFQIVNPTGQFDSVVLWEHTNSYRRFSKSVSGGVKEFLKYIVGMSESEIQSEYGDIGDDSLVKSLRHFDRTKMDTGYSLQDIIYTEGYNQYIESRMISEDTAKYYHLEVNGHDAIIPLYDNQFKRVGSLYRNSSPLVKGDRYRTQLAGTNEKPCAWPFTELKKLKRDSVVVLVEGAWSAMRLHQVVVPYLPKLLPLATLGTNITQELKDYIYEFPIICLLDDDTGGKHVSETLIKWKRKDIEIYNPYFSNLAQSNQSSYIDDLDDKKLLSLFRVIKKDSKLL